MTTKIFWELLEDNPTCDACGGALARLDEDTFYCKKCKDALSLCGSYGTCEGIAHNGPYACQNGELIEAGNLIDGCCEVCGGGWEVT